MGPGRRARPTSRRGRGARVQDVDGRWYLDFPMGLGPIILGHAHPAVNEAIRRQLDDGITFTLPHPLEVEVAERIARRGAVRRARALREVGLGRDERRDPRRARGDRPRPRASSPATTAGTTGTSASTSRRLGVPAGDARRSSTPFAPGDLDALEAALGARAGEVACVILEPSACDEPRRGDLAGVRRRSAPRTARSPSSTRSSAASAWRWAARRSATASLPDLACFGKALGNGMPISALAGRAEHMDVLERRLLLRHARRRDAVARGRAPRRSTSWRPSRVHEHLWRLGERLQAGVREQIARHGVGGLGQRAAARRRGRS